MLGLVFGDEFGRDLETGAVEVGVVGVQHEAIAPGLGRADAVSRV